MSSGLPSCFLPLLLHWLMRATPHTVVRKTGLRVLTRLPHVVVLCAVSAQLAVNVVPLDSLPVRATLVAAFNPLLPV